MPDLMYEKHPDEHYAILTLNRPDRLNAIGGSLMGELLLALTDLAEDDDMRVGIVTGAGRAFSAGADMREGADRDAALSVLRERRERDEITLEAFERESAGLQAPTPIRFDVFSSNPKPIICAINGLAVGGGMHWAMDCDIRLACPEAYLGLPEPKRGIAAGYGSLYLGRLIPHGEAMYYLLTGERIPAEEAHRIGLVHEVVSPERLLPRAVEIAVTIAENAPLAVRATKQLTLFQRQHDAEAAAQFSTPISRAVQASEDVLEGRRAFVEKRPPVWQGR